MKHDRHCCDEGGESSQDTWSLPRQGSRFKTRKILPSSLQLSQSLPPRSQQPNHGMSQEGYIYAMFPARSIYHEWHTRIHHLNTNRRKLYGTAITHVSRNSSSSSNFPSQYDDYNTNHKFQDGSEKVSRPSLNEYFLSEWEITHTCHVTSLCSGQVADESSQSLSSAL